MNWTEENNYLVKKFKFKDFLQAMDFMATAAIEIDKLDHHPEWKNIYNTLEVKLNTHSAGNIVTEKDRELAGILDQIYATYI